MPFETMSSEKERLEKGALEKFAEGFTSSIDRGELKFVRLQTPPEADGLCQLNGSPLNIEVAHVYGTDADVRYLLGRKGYSEPTKEEKFQSGLIPLNERIIGPMNNVLKQKAKKKYFSSPVWLLIRVGIPILTAEEFQVYQGEIKIPDTHPFNEIWLMCGPSLQFGFMQLYERA